jgi:hypothetical protein
MNNSLTSLIEKKTANYARWDMILRDFLKVTFDEHEFDDDQHLQIIKNTNELYIEIANVFIEYGKYKDDLEIKSYFPTTFGLEIFIQSKKMGCNFKFGSDEDGFLLEVYLHNLENLRKMSDEFWRELLELSTLGKFDFEENISPWASVDQEHEPALKNSNSGIFRLLRNHILLSLQKDDLCDVGSLSVRWPFHNDWNTLLAVGSQAFRILYNANYSLWRAGYLRNAEKKRRKLSQS